MNKPDSLARQWIHQDLNGAVEEWESSGNGQSLTQWLHRQLGGGKRSRGVLDILQTAGVGVRDLVAVDHRDVRSGCRFELVGAGRSWLGPAWQSSAAGSVGEAKIRARLSEPGGELAEWCYPAGDARVSHSALLFRKRGLALISMVFEGSKPLVSSVGFQLSLGPGVLAGPIEGSRALQLAPAGKPGSAQVLPIGLPSKPYVTERGSFTLDKREGTLILTQAPVGRRSWVPMLVSWDSRRHRRALSWRMLTVSENARAVTADRAFATRVSWGKTESYVIYRSLTPPRPRTFLGHHTTARFLFGLFTPDGTVTPIVRFD
jgi:hypothetical protein